jgi:hypothetical protein
VQFRGGMQLQKLPQRHALEGTEAPGVLIVEELLRFLRRKALNHTQTILRMALYVNDAIAGCPACRNLRFKGCGFSPLDATLTKNLGRGGSYGQLASTSTSSTPVHPEGSRGALITYPAPRKGLLLTRSLLDRSPLQV